jgi:hypothetical protein
MIHQQNIVKAAIGCLRDPEQTAVAPQVAGSLATLLTSLDDLAVLDHSKVPGLRNTAVMIVDHEHSRVTAPPAPPASGEYECCASGSCEVCRR